MNQIKTIPRTVIKNAAKKNKLWLWCNFHYTDDYAHDNATGFGKSKKWVRAFYRGGERNSPSGAQAHQEGKIGLLEWDFHTSSGGCWVSRRNGECDFTFSIHSNLSYKFTIQESDPNAIGIQNEIAVKYERKLEAAA